ncbi:MAG: peptidoglycan DD-metalloendopeptidase family protein [Schleiferiaceae bacterium]|nr:peptidoglycan DD-metalloendopeptidase family protein [Schleiferiaceae bacterium]
MSHCKRIVTFLFAVLFLAAANGQTKDKKELLQQKRVRLQDEIQLASKILKDTRKDQQLTLSQVQTFGQKIRIREQLIQTIRREVQLFDRQIKEEELEITALEKRIEALKEEYAKLIYSAYKSNSRTSKTMFILASDDFAQAVRRLQYLRKYAEFRKQQVDEIRNKQALLEEKIAGLAVQKADKQKLLSSYEGERKQLLTEKVDLDKAITNLRSQEKELEKSIQKKKAEADKLNAEIERIIAAEMRRAQEAAIRKELETEANRVGLVKGKDYQTNTSNKALQNLIDAKRKAAAAAGTPAPTKPATPSQSFGMTPEAQQMANNFVANKAKLPWPVERGVLVKEFGLQRHQVATQVQVFNSGIDIATEKGARARAVFEGEVVSTPLIPNSPLKAVIIKHGNYFTVYSNLISLEVKVGDTVKVKQVLGEIYADDEQAESVLHFQLWKDMEKQDPKPWLFK